MPEVTFGEKGRSKRRNIGSGPPDESVSSARIPGGSRANRLLTHYVESMKEAKAAMRKLVSSGSPFEPRIGFSRAVRVGQIVAISGTAPIAADGSVACPGDVYGQTRRCLEIVADAVVDAGLSIDTVVRTRIMLTDVSQWEAAARAHAEFFAAIRPATTFVEVQGFINREWLVEVEADCVADR
jgi:enamine deaminase RidA (YjgF/YER057c/UK114 family)